MDTKKFRVGVVGLGRMGSTIDEEGHTKLPYSIASAVESSPHFELVAGSDLIEEKRALFSERWGVRGVYQDFNEMVAIENLDLVAVCTAACLPKPIDVSPGPDDVADSHAYLSIELAALGIPMLYIEKAMASSMKRADQVLEVVSRNGLCYNTGVLRRFDNRYAAVRDAVVSGLIGDVRTVVHYAPATLMHGHIHSIDTISFLLGDPMIRAVRGELLPRDRKFSGRHIAKDPHAIYQIRFDGDVEGYTVPAGCWEFEVFGSDGCIRLMNNGEVAVLRRGSGKRQWHEEPFKIVEPKSPVVACLEDLAHSKNTGEPTLGNVELTHHLTEACIAVAESHLNGGIWMDLPLERRDLYIFHV